MKITAVTGYPVRLGTRDHFIVTVETDDGFTGVGEGGMSSRELAMAGMLEHVGRFLVGMDPRRIEHIWQTVYRAAYFEGGKILGAVVSAIDMALWDILGQSLGVPVWQLLGGASRERVECFVTPGSLTGPEIVAASTRAVADGWRFLRFLPDHAWDSGDGAVYEPLESIAASVRWIHEVRNAVGPAIQLAVDFHHRLSVAEAALFCGQVEDVHLMYLEEPIRAQSPKAYAQLRAMTSVPFAIGEEFSNKWEFAPFIEDGLLNFARLDVSNAGGLTEARKVAGWCEAHYIDIMPHNPLGPVTTAASIHLCIATSNVAQLEYWPDIASGTPRDLFPVVPEIVGNAFVLPTAPGLGVTFNAKAAKEHPFSAWEAPHWRRRDGSYTNW